MTETDSSPPGCSVEGWDRAFFDNSLVGMLLTVPDGRILAANPAACRMFRRSEAELCQLGREGVVDVTDPRLAAALAIRERTGAFSGELRMRRGDGTTFSAELSSRVFTDQNGEPRTSMVIVDVSARVAAETALEHERERLEEIIAQAPSFFSVLRGPEHIFELTNLPYQALIGHRDVIGKPVREALPEVMGQGFVALLDRVYRTGEPVSRREVPVLLQKDPDGEPEEHFLSFVYQPLREADGSVSGIIVQGVDVTSRHVAEAERHAFVEGAAHDLKNPLGVIDGQAQLLNRRLKREADPSTLERGLGEIRSAVRQATTVLEQMLDAAALRAGQPLELRCGSADLVELARAAVERFRLISPQHTVALESRIESLVGVWDVARLERVVTNLLENAIKYSPDGGQVIVRVAEEEGASGRHAMLCVQDEGVGIPAADLPHIFERFRRGGNVVGQIRGSGIGLAGVRQIVEQHGGTIEVESEGTGSAFTVRLPVGYEQA